MFQKPQLSLICAYVCHSSYLRPKLVLETPHPPALLLTPGKETRAKTYDPDVHYYDRHRIRLCVTMIITFMILVVLMVPIYLLYRLAVQGAISTSPKTIGVIFVATLAFSAIISAFTKARRHELLAAAAG